jgi:hypothetical protein
VLLAKERGERGVGAASYPGGVSAGIWTTGLISMEPKRTDGIFAAHSSASSTDSASIR